MSEKTPMICIVCPRGCHLTVDPAADYAVTGNACERGAAYGREELRDPRRTLCSTVRIHGAALPRLPVKTDRPVPKAAIFEAMRQIYTVEARAPVALGDVLLEGLPGGARLVATRSLGKR